MICFRAAWAVEKVEPSINTVVSPLLFDNRARVHKAESPPLKLVRVEPREGLSIKLPESHVVPVKAGQIRRTSSGKLLRPVMLEAFNTGKLELLARTGAASAHEAQITTKLET